MKRILTVLAAMAASTSFAFADGDVKAGKKVFKKCKACHTVKPGKNKTGPSLYNILDAQAGGVEGFSYSGAMAGSGLVWDAETLAAFLTKPKDVVPGTKMVFSGLKKESQIADLIAYLASVSGE